MTHEELLALVDYNETAGVFTWRNPTTNRVKQGAKLGVVDNLGYARTTLHGKHYRLHQLAWLYYYGVLPTKQIDHKNGNRLDNRIVNLRECGYEENQQNAKVKVNNSSGFRGVSWNKRISKWHAYSQLNRKRIHLGFYDAIADAINKVQAFNKETFGEFYRGIS